ncbi:MAG: hypothetical protein JO053_13480 [Acidobacteria bacterium]|nr:hypothetical protein [Acidobacteriota bacterium]
MKLFRSFLAAALLAAFLTTPLIADDLKADEIFAKNLDSIAARETRVGLTNLIARANGLFETPGIRGGGGAVMASDSKDLLFMMSFNSPQYPFERIGWFDAKVDIPFPPGGKRGLLGSFVQEHTGILDSGLFGGVMSARWALYGDDPVKALKARSSGKKKVGDRNCYVVTVVPKGGATQLTVKLYFDAENFQHLRTDYHLEVPAGNVTFGAQNQNANSVVELVETFSDFRDVNGFKLPFIYKADFTANSNATMARNTWTLNVIDYLINQKLKPDFFKFPPAA